MRGNWWTEGIKARDKAKELNATARPKGLIVTFESSGDAEGTVAGHKFWLRREDAPAGSALLAPFGTAKEVEEYLAQFPDLPDGPDATDGGAL